MFKAATFQVGIELALNIAWPRRSLRRQVRLERG
jgi:hypothetical protein